MPGGDVTAKADKAAREGLAKAALLQPGAPTSSFFISDTGGSQ
jgi:hypothetical protein